MPRVGMDRIMRSGENGGVFGRDLESSLKGHHEWFKGSINWVSPTVYSLGRNHYLFTLKQTPDQTEALTTGSCYPVQAGL